MIEPSRARSILAVFLLVALTLSACNGSATSADPISVAVEPGETRQSGTHLDVSVTTPVLSGFPGAQELNARIRTSLDAAVRRAETAADELAAAGIDDRIATLSGSFDCACFPEDDLYSLWITTEEYPGGAHGSHRIESYTFSAVTGAVYSFEGLLDPGSDGPVLVEAALRSAVGGPDFFTDAADTVEAYERDYDFLISGENIIVYFPLYDLAPYAAGIPGFAFPAGDLEQWLKPEIAEALRGRAAVEVPALALQPLRLDGAAD